MKLASFLKVKVCLNEAAVVHEKKIKGKAACEENLKYESYMIKYEKCSSSINNKETYFPFYKSNFLEEVFFFRFSSF